MNPKLSVIVPIYNTEEYLPKCIDGIINQTFKDWELLLIDDGSTDNSLKICNEYAKKDKRIKVFSKKNGGQGSARNLGLKEAKGDYITFMDSDDYLSLDTYETNIKILELNENIDILQFPFTLVYEDEKQNKIKSFPTQLITKDFISLLDWSYLYKEGYKITGLVWDKIYRRRFLHEIFFDESMIFEDTEFLVRVLRGINQLYISDKGMYYYFQRETSSVHKNFNNDYRERSFFKMIIPLYQQLEKEDSKNISLRMPLYLHILNKYNFVKYIYPKSNLKYVRKFLKDCKLIKYGNLYSQIKICTIKYFPFFIYESLAKVSYIIKNIIKRV